MERCTLSRLRADLATGGKWTRNATLAPPYTHMRPDCLHYALPGVPDAWNYALLATLLRMG